MRYRSCSFQALPTLSTILASPAPCTVVLKMKINLIVAMAPPKVNPALLCHSFPSVLVLGPPTLSYAPLHAGRQQRFLDPSVADIRIKPIWAEETSLRRTVCLCHRGQMLSLDRGVCLSIQGIDREARVSTCSATRLPKRSLASRRLLSVTS